MVHLNLAIALLLALIVFVSGVETAKNHRVRANKCVTQNVLYFNDIFRLAVYWSPQFCTTCFWQFLLGDYVKG